MNQNRSIAVRHNVQFRSPLITRGLNCVVQVVLSKNYIKTETFLVAITQQNQCPDVVNTSSSLPEATCSGTPQLSQPEILPPTTPDVNGALSDVPHCEAIPPPDIPPLDKDAVASMMSSVATAVSAIPTARTPESDKRYLSRNWQC